MKFTAITVLFVLLGILATAQTKGARKLCRLYFNTKAIEFDRFNSLIVIKKTDEMGNSIVVNKVRPLRGVVSISLQTNEPFYVNAELTVGKKLISMSSSFLITNDDINVTFLSTPMVTTVTGGENDFIFNNRFLFLSLPYFVANTSGYSPAVSKKNYELAIPDNIRLQLYWKEYEYVVFTQVSANRSLYFTLEKLDQAKDNLSTKTLENCFNELKDTLKLTKLGQKIRVYLKNSKKLFIGQQAPAFTVVDSIMAEIKSSDILTKDKYTLIDFWASWCYPCRIFMKELKNIYTNRIDTLKFQIVSVSIDTDRQRWLQASSEDSINWKNFLETSEKSEPISKMYNITAVPQNIIIDQEGRIVEKDLSIQKLQDFLGKHKLIKR